MSVTYRAISWNRQKRLYDLALTAGIAIYLGSFIGLGSFFHPRATIETLLIRGFGTIAFLTLHLALAIGPLCRISPRLLPLLYNRRHLGVATFLLGLMHGLLSIFQFHALGDLNPLVSVLSSNTRYASLANFPFQPLGLASLAILFLMAATSHDFWLRTLTAPVWKRLHMLVYLAYALLVAHVVFGALQSERSPILSAALAAGMALILGLHLAAAYRERQRDTSVASIEGAGHGDIDVGAVDEIPDGRARVVVIGGERVAIFRYDGQISAVSNVCRHQHGPLGEGRIIDGCITCPWHGYQYLPATGAAPPPFTERVPTFRVWVLNSRVLIDPRPLPAGTWVEPALVCASEGVSYV
jgi:nitrite reductase/ring-hydroxylating ferredoxin subunit/DMSO/TMAO reductase YedYZ heme-binding membrane subunit